MVEPRLEIDRWGHTEAVQEDVEALVRERVEELVGERLGVAPPVADEHASLRGGQPYDRQEVRYDVDNVAGEGDGVDLRETRAKDHAGIRSSRQDWNHARMRPGPRGQGHGGHAVADEDDEPLAVSLVPGVARAWLGEPTAAGHARGGEPGLQGSDRRFERVAEAPRHRNRSSAGTDDDDLRGMRQQEAREARAAKPTASAAVRILQHDL